MLTQLFAADRVVALQYAGAAYVNPTRRKRTNKLPSWHAPRTLSALPSCGDGGRFTAVTGFSENNERVRRILHQSVVPMLVGRAMHTQTLRSRIQIIRHGCLASIACISMVFGTGCTPEKNSANLEMEKLQGTWQLLYQQMNGKKLPDEKTAEMLHGKMVFTGDKIRYTVELPGCDFEIAYKLRPDQKPKAIDLQLTGTVDKKGIGLKTFGIYLLQEDTLKICHSKTNRPTDFNAGAS
jgi:uncharacterized protein (TIGR03067 family)